MVKLALLMFPKDRNSQDKDQEILEVMETIDMVWVEFRGVSLIVRNTKVPRHVGKWMLRTIEETHDL